LDGTQHGYDSSHRICPYGWTAPNYLKFTCSS
jgi:hypothetical protein